MAILKAGETKVTKRDIIKSLVELKQMVKLPKMEFTVPDEIADFLNEDIKNPLTNVKWLLIKSKTHKQINIL